MGNFRVHRVEEYLATVPREWVELRDEGREGIFVPMYRREALRLAFGGVSWKPNAVQIGLGGANVLSGEPLDAGLHDTPQNYIIAPNQPWLFGMRNKDGGGYIPHSQFHILNTIEVVLYDPMPGIFPNEPPHQQTWPDDSLFEESVQPYRLGGQDEGHDPQFAIRSPHSAIVDPYGPETWEREPCGRVDVHLVGIEQYRQITGHEPPHTPVTADTYSAAGLPWLESYEEK